MAVKEWKLREQQLAEARTLARHDREPFAVVCENGRVFPKALRKALVMCESPRHRGARIVQEVEP